MHEALFRLIQPVSATGFLTTAGKLTEEDTCFLVNFGGNSSKVFIIVIKKEEKEERLCRNEIGEGRNRMFFEFQLGDGAHRIARFFPSFHFLRNFDRQSGKDYCVALRVANTLDSRLSSGLRFSRNEC